MRKNYISLSVLSNFFLPVRSIFIRINTWQHEHNKLIIIRRYYFFIRFVLISYHIWLRKRKKLIIIGCGRSGTKFISHLFNEMGVEIGHERLAKHGIASWYLVPNTYKMERGPSFYQISYLNMPVVHQVRHPLDVISSVNEVIGHKSWKYICNYIPIEENDSKLLKSMKYWYFWNILAEKKSIYTYRIENIQNDLFKIIAIGKLNIHEDNEKIGKTKSKIINSRKHSKIGWDDLMSVDEELTNKILNLARRYGYEV